MAETVTCLSGESTSLPFAVTVTAPAPALVVSPAAMVSVAGLDSVKSPVAAFIPANADTVSVTALLDLPESVAVTDDTPPVSEIDAADSTSATIGNASSSVMVSVTSEGCPATPWELDALPETVTCLSGASTSLSAAVTVTAPVLVVSPAAIVSVFALDSV